MELTGICAKHVGAALLKAATGRIPFEIITLAGTLGSSEGVTLCCILRTAVQYAVVGLEMLPVRSRLDLLYTGYPIAW